MCQRIGRPPISTIGFGLTSVSSECASRGRPRGSRPSYRQESAGAAHRLSQENLRARPRRRPTVRGPTTLPASRLQAAGSTASRGSIRMPGAERTHGLAETPLRQRLVARHPDQLAAHRPRRPARSSSSVVEPVAEALDEAELDLLQPRDDLRAHACSRSRPAGRTRPSASPGGCGRRRAAPR